jgi:glycosyltransferase involved in cell wall biosynthesis
VYVCDEYPGVASRFGGIGVAMKQEAEWFVRQGAEVTVVVATAGQPAGRGVQNGVSIVVPPLSTTPRWSVFANRLRTARATGDALGKASGLAVCADYSGPLWRKTFPHPLIVQLHGCATLNAAQQGRKPNRVVSWFEQRTISVATAIQSCSDFTARHTAEVLDLGGRRVRTVYSPVDAEFFSPAPDEVQPGLVAFVGKLNRLKGVFVLAEAMIEVLQSWPKSHLVMAGHDSVESGRSVLEEFLKLIPAELQERIRISGPLSRGDVASLLRQAAMLVLPSWSEAFPIVVLEAMASGRPVVASDRGGIPEIVRDGLTGLLADPEQPKTFAHAILSLLREPRRADAMGAAGRAAVLAAHTPDQVYRNTAAFHRETLGAGGIR